MENIGSDALQFRATNCVRVENIRWSILRSKLCACVHIRWSILHQSSDVDPQGEIYFHMYKYILGWNTPPHKQVFQTSCVTCMHTWNYAYTQMWHAWRHLHKYDMRDDNLRVYDYTQVICVYNWLEIGWWAVFLCSQPNPVHKLCPSEHQSPNAFSDFSSWIDKQCKIRDLFFLEEEH